MSTITIDGLVLSDIPLGIQSVNVKYRRTSDPDTSGSYTVVNTAAKIKTIPQNGIPTANFLFVDNAGNPQPLAFNIENANTSVDYTIVMTVACNNSVYSEVVTIPSSNLCNCPDGFTESIDLGMCYKLESKPAEVINSGYCLAASKNVGYSTLGTRIYTYPFNNSKLAAANNGDTEYILTTFKQWKEDHFFTEGAAVAGATVVGLHDPLTFSIPSGMVLSVSPAQPSSAPTMVAAATAPIGATSITVQPLSQDVPDGIIYMVGGPMNRDSVWIDSDCDGLPNALASGAKTTIPYTYTSPSDKRVYVGIGVDQHCILTVNETVIAHSLLVFPDAISAYVMFYYFHIIPVDIKAGVNRFNITVTGDGTVDDSVAMVIYDNTAAQIAAATDDSQLTVLFSTRNLRELSYSIATCDEGWSLDNTGGVYSCNRTVYVDCGGSKLTITTQPFGGSVIAGTNKTFLVTATGGSAPFTYQWQRKVDGSWINISGATNASYVHNVQSSDNGSQFRVVVKDSSTPMQTEVSVAATLAVAGSGFTWSFMTYEDDPYNGAGNAPDAGGTVILSGTIANATDPIVIPKTTPGFENTGGFYWILKMQTGIAARVGQTNGTNTYTPLVGNIYYPVITNGGFNYLVSSDRNGIDPNVDLTFTAQ